jgi:replicative DNA helicase Mcm
MPEASKKQKKGGSEDRADELTAKFKEFIHHEYMKELTKAANEDNPLVVDFKVLEKFSPEMADMLLSGPDAIIEIAQNAVKQIELPSAVSGVTEAAATKVRFSNLPEAENVNIRDLRSKHLNRFLCTEGTVRRASEVRPEITETIWECSDCGEKTYSPRKGGFISKPFQCSGCKGRSFKQMDKKLIDARWVTIEEPFESVEGEKPSQLNLILTEDLVSQKNRRVSDPGNRIKINGILREIPKGKFYSAKLDFFFEGNFVEPTEVGWERMEVTKEDEKKIKDMAKDPKVYDKLIGSLAPSLYGMLDIKEAIILQMFGGVPRTLKDKTKFRGDIHLLLIGDPASGKSQILKLAPSIVQRAKYVSGKGTTAAGLTATVTRDEMMGGWVLEAGAMVLANKGLLAVDEFEKMSPEDQVAMHEALEQGTVSIAKASIVATLPAQTSVLAGGNPKFSRFDRYRSVAEQINITDTLLSRFDLKFILRDEPNAEQDKKMVDHILRAREGDYPAAEPIIDPELIRKYVAYAKTSCKPKLTKETGRLLKEFYLKTRKKAEGGNAPIPITLRQFESLMRLAEASAKIQLSNEVRGEDVDRAMRLMKSSLQQLGFDPEMGAIDIDKSEGGTSYRERSQIRVLLDLINTMSLKKREIPLKELEAAARKEGIEDIDGLIEKLKREGMLFEPSPGFLQKV